MSAISLGTRLIVTMSVKRGYYSRALLLLSDAPCDIYSRAATKQGVVSILRAIAQ